MPQLKIAKIIINFLLIISLTACGTTSQLKNSGSSSAPITLSQYQTIIVNDFTDGASGDDPMIIQGGKKFADAIASSVKRRELFRNVQRNNNSIEHALLIDGQIIRYNEGNQTLRLLAGFGAGSSNFDAKVNVRDNETKKILGHIDINKCSYALGGIIASAQDVKYLTLSAASTIADELSKTKKSKN